MNLSADAHEGSHSGAWRALLVALGAYLLWVAIALWRDDAAGSRSISYLFPPLTIAAGALLGRWCARGRDGLLVPAAASALALALLLVIPIYPNAAAMAGIQLVAVSGLLLAGAACGRGRPRSATARLILTVSVGALGVLLAARAQAASVLVVVVVVVVALAVRCGPRPSRRAVLMTGLGAVGAAALAVVVLGSAPDWPHWMEDAGSLSRARRDLWRDALALWREHWLLGGGPGSFFESSATARSEPHLYAAHSSLLQVASELGAGGVLLFGAVLATGAVFAVSGDQALGMIGVSAWSALAVHSMIDHLYELPIVCLLAGAVIGWSGSRAAPRSPSPRWGADRGNDPA